MTHNQTGAPRRRKGEGSIGRHHNHATCPPVREDGTRPEHKCKGLWRARVTVKVAGGKTAAKTVYGKTEAEVVRKRDALKVESTKGRIVAGKSGTFGAWLEEWYAEVSGDLKPNTRNAYSSYMRQWIVPHLGHIRLDALRAEHIEELYDRMRKQGRATGTVRQAHAVVSRSLKIARRRRLVGTNVALEVEPPSQKVTTPRRPLSVAEAWRVLDAAGDNPRAAVALLTGLRQGEALALRWSDVYLDGTTFVPIPHLVVRQSVAREHGVGFVFGDPKSATSKDRVVPLVPQVAEPLRKWREASDANDAALVFPNRHGGVLNKQTDRDRWFRLLEKAGVERAVLHAARNTSAALLQSTGIDVGVVAEILGHADTSMTRRYQQGNREAVMDAMDRLGAYMEASRNKAQRKANKRSAA